MQRVYANSGVLEIQHVREIVGNVFGLDEQLQPTLADMHERLEDPTIVHRVRDTGGRVTLEEPIGPGTVFGELAVFMMKSATAPQGAATAAS